MYTTSKVVACRNHNSYSTTPYTSAAISSSFAIPDVGAFVKLFQLD